MHDLTAFQRDLLYIVASETRPKGLSIKERLDEYYGEEVNHGRLYPNLDDLVGMGLVDKGAKDRRTNYYELTQRGRREIAAHQGWMSEQLAAGDIELEGDAPTP